MRTLNQILTDINQRIAANLSYSTVVYWNEAALQQKDEVTFPVVNSGDKTGTQLSPTDYTLQCYHRIISSETITNPQLGHGKYPYRARLYTIRNVWLGNLGAIPQQVYEFNDDVKNDVYNAFPVILTDKETVITINENVNKSEVLEQEFSGFDLNNLNLQLIAFYIEYTVKQRIRCA